MEGELTATARENDADFLHRVARRWTEALDHHGAEPSEELLRRLQGAFLRKPRHGLQHLEIFATADQFEHLVTVMNTATNPRVLNQAADGAQAPCAGDASEPGSIRPAVATGNMSAASPQLDRRSRPQKLLDGLVGACKAALSAGTLPAAGGLRPQIIVTISYQDLLAELRDRVGVDAIPAGRAAARAGMRGPRGGPTSTGNGTLLCSHHHHVIHKEDWCIRVRNGVPWFVPPAHLDPKRETRRNHYFRC
ncbi:DUF222 domain-containing protein [Arthrobacter cavernae]|uniref:DUF222 domain-containing protein n=1 Tax=Arthrobacter cavernae TaxID=2817681 RepID=UPI003557F735